MRITLRGKILRPWDEDDVLRKCSWESKHRTRIFRMWKLRVGVCLASIRCLNCGGTRPDPKPFPYGVRYFQVGYLAIFLVKH